MAATIDEWREAIDKLTPLRDDDVHLHLVAPLQPTTNGGSGSFLGRASDGQLYFIKPLNNLQSPRVCYTEVVVSALGQAVQAPVCDVVPIQITEDVEGWEFRGGRRLERGIASASRLVDGVTEDRQLLYRARDDNRRRHVGVLALSAWLGGGDEQWLYCQKDDERTYSHDHGHFLPDGPDWSASTLHAHIVEPPRLPSGPEGHAGLDQVELVEMIERLQTLNESTIASHDMWVSLGPVVSRRAGSMVRSS